mgnify:FL=1
MANLSASELRKYDWRSEVFIKKLQEKTPFEVSGGKKVILKSSQNDIKILKSGSNSELSSLRFMGDNGQQYKLSDIVKNVEFGGKGDRAGTVKEDRALESLRQQIMEAKKFEKSATINIRIAGKIYKVYDAESTPGTPKSDFHLIDQDGKEIVWISHKDGKTEKDFQQWGGMSERVEPTINRHPESQNFIKTLLQIYPKGIPNATTVARKIKDKKLKMMSVYGNGFSGSFGRQNVTITIQGEIGRAHV